MITCPTPHPDLFFFTYINTHAQENVMLCLLKLFALKVQIAKDWQTSELQWPSGTIWNKNSPTKYYTQNSQFFLRTYLFKPIMLGACSISIVYPWYSRCHSLPIISLLWKVSLSMICSCNSVQDTHEIDPCVLNPSAYTSCTCDPLQHLLRKGFLGSFGGEEFQWWIDGISMVGQHKSGLKFALPSWSIYEFP